MTARETLDGIRTRYIASQQALANDSRTVSIRIAHRLSESANDVPRLSNAVEAALALHSRVAIYECNDAGFPQTEDESKFVRDICGVCSDSSVTENLDDGNYDLAGEYGEVSYPCPTVAAIENALKERP